MIEIVAHGIMIDDIVFPDGVTKMDILGGGGPQTAWGAAVALGSGERVGLIAGVNHDFDTATLAPINAVGVNTDGIHRNDLPTPRAWQILEFDGERKHVWRVPEDTLPTQLERGWNVAPESYRGAKFFHWGIHPDDAELDKHWAKKLHENDIPVSLEPFIPSAKPLPLDELRSLLEHVDVFSVNDYEAAQIAGIDDDNAALIQHYKEAGCHYLLLRQGENGSEVWDCHRGEGVSVPAVKTTVVDVVGAGNAYTGAFLARLADGIDVAACHASAAASYLIEQVGLPPSPPNPDDYRRRIAEAEAGLKVIV